MVRVNRAAGSVKKAPFRVDCTVLFMPVLFVLTLFALMSGFLNWPICGLRLRPAAMRVNSGHPMLPPLDKLFVSRDPQHEVSWYVDDYSIDVSARCTSK